ncbi:MAG: DUF6095 family protein [Bacteroidota bacterium]
MNQKHTNKEKLGKGLKILAGALPLIFLGPVVLFSAFNNQDKFLFIPVLILACLMLIAAIYLIFLGIKKLLDALFNK